MITRTSDDDGATWPHHLLLDERTNVSYPDAIETPEVQDPLGLTAAQDPVKVEHEMMEIIDREDWTLSNHLLIDHGRSLCSARRPLCEECPVSPLCPKKGI